MLHQGDSGPDVAKVIQALLENGFDCGDDLKTGVFGPATANALRMFQASHLDLTKHPLIVDGVVGPMTQWALDNPSGSAQEPDDTNYTADLSLCATDFTRSGLTQAMIDLNAKVHEVPDGSNRGPRIDIMTGMQGKPLSIVGPPWCAYGLTTWYNVYGDSAMGHIGLAQGCARWAQANGCIITWSDVKPGDAWVIFHGDDHGHTGMVRSRTDVDFKTVECNAGNAVRSYPRKPELINVFFRPIARA